MGCRHQSIFKPPGNSSVQPELRTIALMQRISLQVKTKALTQTYRPHLPTPSPITHSSAHWTLATSHKLPTHRLLTRMSFSQWSLPLTLYLQLQMLHTVLLLPTSRPCFSFLAFIANKWCHLLIYLFLVCVPTLEWMFHESRDFFSVYYCFCTAENSGWHMEDTQ